MNLELSPIDCFFTTYCHQQIKECTKNCSFKILWNETVLSCLLFEETSTYLFISNEKLIINTGHMTVSDVISSHNTFSCPCPMDKNFNLLDPNSILSASLAKSLAGSEPGLKMKTMGEVGVLCSNTDSKLMIGGVTYFSPIHLVTNSSTAL